MKTLVLCTFVAVAVIAGAGQRSKSSTPKVSLLMFDGCPNSPKMKTNLQAAMKALHLTGIEVVDILKLPASDVRKGYGAPTVLVNGKDLFGHAVPTSAAASCRLYPGGVPSVAEIQKQLTAVIGPKH